MNIGNIYDNIIGIFSPATALNNRRMRELMSRNSSRSAYMNESASTEGGWDAPHTANSGIREDRQKIANHVRQLTRKMPWMDSAIEAAVAYKVGEGFSFRPAVVDETGALDKKVNAILKDAFLRWCENCEVNGEDHFGDLQQLAARQMIECGEAVFIHKFNSSEGYRLKTIEPDCISSLKQQENIDQGIEFDPETNRVIKYHFIELDTTLERANKEYEIPSKNVIHLFKRKRPWQRRGISPISPYVNLAMDLGDYLANELAAQQMTSRWLGFVTDPNADANNPGEAQARKVLYNLTLEYLPPGKSIQLAPGANRPTLGVETFQKIFLRAISTVIHVPYHVVSGEYSSMNYNTLREVRNNTVHLLKPEWSYFTRHFLNPVYRRWLQYEVAAGKIQLKNFFKNPSHYEKCFFMPPGIESVDILRDIKGVVTGSQYGIYDPQDWIMAQGEDPEEIVSGIASFSNLMSEHGLKFPQVASESDTNIGGDTGDGMSEE